MHNPHNDTMIIIHVFIYHLNHCKSKDDAFWDDAEDERRDELMTWR